jgi:hypothetical protein
MHVGQSDAKILRGLPSLEEVRQTYYPPLQERLYLHYPVLHDDQGRN